jgi:hypothetical protein
MRPHLAIASIGILGLSVGCSSHAPTNLFDTTAGGIPLNGGDAGGDAAQNNVCPAGGIQEVEPNDSPGQATMFTMTVCGQIASSSDIDFFKFTLDKNTKKFFFSFVGNVTVTVRVQGEEVTLTPQMVPNIPFFVSVPYSLEVRSADGNPQYYSLTVQPMTM